MCVPPDFRDWIEGLGIPVVPIGPELRGTAASGSAVKRTPPSPEEARQRVEDTVNTQFATIGEAARGCDLLVAAGFLQIAARSVAEASGVPYVFAAYCPIALPSPRHAPPPMPGVPPASHRIGTRELWARDAQYWEATFGAVLNAGRASAGLEPVSGVRDHVSTDRPWLAADPTLGPWPEPGDPGVFQTGAWMWPDRRPLPPDLETFLEDGEPPVYFGFGSMRAPEDLGRVMVRAARKLGRRAIVSCGWADLSPVNEGPDCVSIGEVNHQALFRRVAAVVHHGGAGTTTAAARAGAPQVVIPQLYDQHYWARRVEDLGMGSAHPPTAPTTESLVSALGHALRPETAANARSVAALVRTDGAATVARRLLESVRRSDRDGRERQAGREIGLVELDQ